MHTTPVGSPLNARPDLGVNGKHLAWQAGKTAGGCRHESYLARCDASIGRREKDAVTYEAHKASLRERRQRDRVRVFLPTTFGNSLDAHRVEHLPSDQEHHRVTGSTP